MSARLRFAPSPTGKLHVGNTRTALINWLFCKKMNGSFMLRLDDTDQERSKDIFAEAIKRDLTWLGLTWDKFFKQSERRRNYDKTSEALKALGRLYPCYETPEELDLKRKIQLSKGLPPIYDREALSLTKEQIDSYVHQGRQPHWRFKLEQGNIKWHDLVRGDVDFEALKLSDPVLIRADGAPLFTLTTVVDDIETNITHIFRGEDHVTNTAIQIQIFKALGHKLPEFGHFPLLTDHKGYGLSKRLGSLSVEELREQNILPISIIGFLSHLGTNKSDDGQSSLECLAENFDLKAFGRAAPKFDPKELLKINEKYLQHISFDYVREKVKSLLPHADEEILKRLWTLLQPNIKNIEEFLYWYEVCMQNITPPSNKEDYEFLKESQELLPPEPWSEDTWNLWIHKIKEKSDRKGKMLYMPLRRALTGKEEGPELKIILPLIGRERVIKRLNHL